MVAAKMRDDDLALLILDYFSSGAAKEDMEAIGMKQSVEQQIATDLSRPHRSSECPAKGMFGRDCRNCQREGAMPIHTIEWDERDGKPFAHIELIELSLSINQLTSLISDLREVQGEMIWYAAKWLQVSATSANKTHLLRKADYEANKRHKALCGKLPNGAWDEHWKVEPILDGPGSLYVCQVCHKLYEKAQDCDEEWSNADDRFITPALDLDAHNEQALDAAYGPEETR